jgi:hypothetical protein
MKIDQSPNFMSNILSLEEDCNEVEVTSYLKSSVIFGMRLEGVC